MNPDPVFRKITIRIRPSSFQKNHNLYPEAPKKIIIQIRNTDFDNLFHFRFAQALEIVPRVLAENSGVKPKEVISKLYAAHNEGKSNVGFDIEGESGDVKVIFVCT